MAIRDVVAFPHPILKQRCVEVTQFDADLHILLEDMAQTMVDADGIGLAANQVGVAVRVFLMDVPVTREPGKAARAEQKAQHPEQNQRTGLVEIINPQILARRGEMKYEEGCLSFPGVNEWVQRAAEIDLQFQDRHGAVHQVTAQGLVAVCIQHEIDHLDGITFLDRLSPFKRKIAMREYLRQNRDVIEDQAMREKLKQKRVAG